MKPEGAAQRERNNMGKISYWADVAESSVMIGPLARSHSHLGLDVRVGIIAFEREVLVAEGKESAAAVVGDYRPHA